MECVNVEDGVLNQLRKLASINLCPNLSGQITVALMMRPPQEGDPSYPLYAKERDDILQVSGWLAGCRRAGGSGVERRTEGGEALRLSASLTLGCGLPCRRAWRGGRAWWWTPSTGWRG